jgi:hypothetical protein
MLKKACYISICCFIPLFVFCQGQRAGDLKEFYTRVVAGPAISLYGINTLTSANVSQGAAFYAGLMEEMHVHQNIYFVGGLEYQYHSMAFNSYYINPGHQFIYNQKYNYTYNLRMQEARLNLLLRLTQGNELRDEYSFYAEGGYVLRCLFVSKMKVTGNANGQTMFNGTTHADFEGPVLQNKFSSGIKLTLGIQHNFLRSHRAWFVQLTGLYGLSRFLIHEDFTPPSLYVKSSFIQLGLGYKF